MISIIVGYANGYVIGKDNDLPWHLRADLQRFTALTTDHTVIMGRKTFESIVARLGHPLPNRTNIVISSKLDPGEGYEVARSLEQALENIPNEEEAFILGGAQVFSQALPKVVKLYVTEIDADIDGDTHFPELDLSAWKVESKEKHPADEQNDYPYTFVNLVRKNG
nr:Dihydrofolate reductase [uncultured bacterium]